MAIKRRKRKRKSRYHTGVHLSTKTGQSCKYRSGWEFLYLQWLDSQESVVTFVYEGLKIPYLSNTRSGKMRNYIPDFLVEYVDGHRELVEIKPKRKLTNRVVQKKLTASQAYCGAHGLTMVVITEDTLKVMGLMLVDLREGFE